MFSDLDERRRDLLDDFVTWRNLEALRAAASQMNGVRRPATRAVARTRKSASRTGRAASGRGGPRRRTVH
jgi:hypothetical protein